MNGDDRPPRDEVELEKTREIYEKIKNVTVNNNMLSISVENDDKFKLSNDWITYRFDYRGKGYTIMRSYQRDFWIVYNRSEVSIEIAVNYSLNPEYPDLLPTNWMDKLGKKQLTHWNEIIDKFNQEAIKLL